MGVYSLPFGHRILIPKSVHGPSSPSSLCLSTVAVANMFDQPLAAALSTAARQEVMHNALVQQYNHAGASKTVSDQITLVREPEK